jgi:hypothetical protein
MRRIDPKAKAVLVPVRITGPTGRVEEAVFVLDTGTPVSIINEKMALDLDLGKDESEGQSNLWGPTGADEGYRIRPTSIALMGRSLEHIQVRCHKLSAGVGVDGLIGLDILRRGRLTLDLPWGHLEFRWN